MIDVQGTIKRVERRASFSKTPQAEIRIAWIEALTKYDHCDDMRTAMSMLLDDMIEKYCKEGTLKSELLSPYLDKIREIKKDHS